MILAVAQARLVDDAPPAPLVGGGHLARRDFKCGKQCRGAVALIIVAVTGQRPAITPRSLPDA